MPIQKQCRIYNFYWIAWGPKQYCFLVPNHIKRQAKSQNKAYVKPTFSVNCTTVLAVVNHTAHPYHLLLFLALNYYLFTLKYEGWQKIPIIGKTRVNSWGGWGGGGGAGGGVKQLVLQIVDLAIKRKTFFHSPPTLLIKIARVVTSIHVFLAL